MKKEKKSSEGLKWTGIALSGVLASVTATGGAMLAFDQIITNLDNTDNGIPLVKGGLHLSKGEHRVVLTDQFCSYFDQRSDIQQNLIMGAFKEVYKNLNEYNSCLDFKLCTTNEDVSKKFFIPKIDAGDINQTDISFRVKKESKENENKYIAYTSGTYNTLTREQLDMVITFNDYYMNHVREIYSDRNQTFSPKNSLLYVVTAHETMHTMGFAHIEDVDSVMYPKTRADIKDFTEYDKQILDKYNVVFYGAEPTYQESKASSEENSYSSYISSKQSEEEMSF